MFKEVSAADRLKAIREETGMTIREVATALGKQPSTYQHYEDRFKKRYLPPELVQSLALIFMEKGVEPDRVLHLAGYNRDLDVFGEVADEAGPGPNPLGPDGKLLTDDSSSDPTGDARKQSPRNTFSLTFQDDLVIVSASVDREKLAQLIKRLQAIHDTM